QGRDVDRRQAHGRRRGLHRPPAVQPAPSGIRHSGAPSQSHKPSKIHRGAGTRGIRAPREGYRRGDRAGGDPPHRCRALADQRHRALRLPVHRAPDAGDGERHGRGRVRCLPRRAPRGGSKVHQRCPATMTVLLVLFFMMPGFWPSLPTDTLTLDAAREAATLRFQERGQQGIYADLTALQLQDLGAGRLPQVTLSGRAVYQSEVPKLPIEMPGFSPPEVARDQYEIALGVEQLLFDAGRTSAQREVARASGSLEQARVEVQIHDYLQRADAAYFGALLQNTAVEVLHSHREELLLRRRMLTARRESGLLTGGEIDELDVQVLEWEQRLAEARGLQVAALQALGVLTGLDIAPDAVLEAPVVDASPEAGQGLRRSTTPGEDASFADRPGLARPENRVFELQRDRLKRQV